MKVLQVINSLQIGGAEVFLKDFVLFLHQQGINVSVALLSCCHGPLEKELRASGINILTLNNTGIYSPKQILFLGPRLKQYDLVHVHLFPAQLWITIGRKLFSKKTPLITTEHSTYNHRRKAWYRPLDYWMYGQYQAITCISDATKLALSNWIPGIEKKAYVVPNGINLGKFRSAIKVHKNQLIKKDNCPVILSVGRLEPEKDQATLLRALVKVKDANLVLVGDGGQRGNLEKLAFALGIADRVHFLGRRQDVPELIKMADIYVQSSRWEGFGLAALEAMAGGLPVIASNVPGLSQVIENAGLLFPPGDSQALADHINSLLSSQELRDNLSQAGALRAENFSIESTVNRFIEIYQRILSSMTERKIFNGP